jgi:hypothetical protein
MDKLKWIDSEGGPLILISDKTVGLWSGILKRSAYLANIEDDADDFLDPEEADYGKACLFKDYLGLLNINNEDVLILGGEPMLTTFLISSGKPVLARWYYGEDEVFVDETLLNIDLNSIDNWKFSLTINLTSDKQLLFDSAYSESMLNKQQQDYLQINIKSGEYKVSTSVYEPDNKTKLILHKLEMTS